MGRLTMKKPKAKTKGAQKHRENPSGDPPEDDGGVDADGGDAGGTATLEADIPDHNTTTGSRGGVLSRIPVSNKKLLLAGAGALALVVAYMVLKNQDSRTPARRQLDEAREERREPPEPEGEAEQDSEEDHLPVIEPDPDDPLSADDQAFQFIFGDG